MHGAPFTFFPNLDNTILILSSKIKRLTLPVVDAFIADLKDAVREAKVSPSGSGTMVAVYGTSFISIFFSPLSAFWGWFLCVDSAPFLNFGSVHLHCILSLWRLQQSYGSFEGALCRMELSYIYPVIFFMLLASLYRQSSASVRFDADTSIPACSCRPRIVRINDSLYVRYCFFPPLRLDVDFPHGFRRLRFSPFFYHPIFNHYRRRLHFYLRPCLLTN